MSTRPTSRVIRAARPGELELALVPLLRPEAGQVLVAAEFSCISPGTERIALSGEFEPGTHWDRWVNYPFALGYSTVGRIADVHPSSAGPHAIGDWVCVHRPHADLRWVDAAEVVPVGNGTPLRPAAGLFALAALTQGAVRELGSLLGEHVVVAGAGPVGQLCVAFARLAGARQVTVVTRTRSRDDLSRLSGAAYVAHSEQELTRLLPDEGVTVAIDATGSGELLPSLSRVVRKRGTILLIGDTPHPGRQTTGGDLLRKGIVLRHYHDSMLPRTEPTPQTWWTHSRIVRYYLDLVADGSLRLDHLITHRFPSDRWKAAYDVVLGAEPHCAVLLDWSGSDA